jgi:acyl dehydratase
MHLVKYFEHYTAGLEENLPESHKMTEEEILEFGERWDPQPFHTDREAAEKSIFGGLVASTVHLFSVATKLGMSQPEDEKPAAVSALGFTNVHLKSPARPGDTQYTGNWLP